MQQLNRAQSCGGAVLVALLLLTACGGSSPSSSNSTADKLTTLTPLKVGLVGKLAGYWDMWVALQEGYFKAENIDISFDYIDTDARLTDAVLAGADSMDPETVFVDYQANQHGGDLTMFCGNQNTPFYRMLGKKGMTSLSELSGKKVAVSDKDSGVDSFVTQEWLGQKGIQPGQYTLVNAGGLANRVAALSSGAVDATPLVPPFDLQTRDKGFADLGISTDTLKHFMFTAWTARASWLKQNQAMAVSFCRAIAKGAKFLHDPANKDQSIKDLVDAAGIAQATATATYDSLVPVLSTDGSIDTAGFAPWSKYLNASAADITKLVDVTYFKRAQATT
jgi:NitT/TauT family transport system substrate-binding protein